MTIVNMDFSTNKTGGKIGGGLMNPSDCFYTPVIEVILCLL